MLGSKCYYRWDLYYTWVQLLHLCLLQASTRSKKKLSIIKVFEQAFMLVPTFVERNPQSTCLAASLLAKHLGVSLDCDRSMT